MVVAIVYVTFLFASLLFHKETNQQSINQSISRSIGPSIGASVQRYKNKKKANGQSVGQLNNHTHNIPSYFFGYTAMAAVEAPAAATDQATKRWGTPATDVAAATRLPTATRHVPATDQTKVTDHPATLATAAGVLSSRNPFPLNRALCWTTWTSCTPALMVRRTVLLKK